MTFFRRPLAQAALILSLFVTLSLSAHTNALAQDMENTLYLDTQYGRTVIKLRPDLAPNHVERIKTLTRKGFL